MGARFRVGERAVVPADPVTRPGARGPMGAGAQHGPIGPGSEAMVESRGLAKSHPSPTGR
ncbi:hypothetical protein HMPREF0682_1570 [Propionibacterium acidifaciens F0233]|uniref:Uncharacterized protein n=1 Tax=Propionibacterium acidifaciens F0233 TaxID=553198 RepID=U2QBG8_9ACTN|nr:hypothetical protein HMPREF0682_1570 [Propionibacterium acidifaciens F0233]